MIAKQEEFSDKHILLHIQYLLDNGVYEPRDIKRVIINVKNMYEMTQEVLVDDIEAMLLEIELSEEEEEGEDKQELELEQKINQYLKDLSIEGVEEKEDTVIYISNLSNEKYIELVGIFRSSLKIKYSLTDFFKRLSKPFTTIGYVSVDIVKNVIERVVADIDMSKSLKTYVLHEIVAFMTYTGEQ